MQMRANNCEKSPMKRAFACALRRENGKMGNTGMSGKAKNARESAKNMESASEMHANGRKALRARYYRG